MAKKNLTVRIDDELREQLQLIADAEMRPLANQIVYFLARDVDAYKATNHIYYDKENGSFKLDGTVPISVDF